jgi:hypothetical protein
MSRTAKGKRGATEGDERAEPDPASSELAKEGKAAVLDIKTAITSEALRIIHEIMPQKVR